MSLSRIWTAFIIISVLVAAYQWILRGNDVVFNKMVVGKADETYPYVTIGAYNGDTSAAAKTVFANEVKYFGFVKKDSVKDAKYIITDDPNADTIKTLKKNSPDLTIFTYSHAKNLDIRPVDGIFETCKSAVNIS